MGTRNLTMMVIDGKFRIAQYGQWDGYPEGQGITILKFMRDKFTPSFVFEKFPKIKFVTEDQLKDTYKTIGVKDS